MFFTIFDLILILILFIFIAFGFVMGLVEAVGAVIGLVLGVWISGIYYQDLAGWLQQFLVSENLSRVVAFVLLFFLISRLVGFLFHLISRAINLIKILPFIKSINRVAGGSFGALEGVLVLGVILFTISKFPFSDWWNNLIVDSNIALYLIASAKVLTPFLPTIFL